MPRINRRWRIHGKRNVLKDVVRRVRVTRWWWQFGGLEKGNRRTIRHPKERMKVRHWIARRGNRIVHDRGDEVHAEQRRIERDRRRRVMRDVGNMAQHIRASG